MKSTLYPSRCELGPLLESLIARDAPDDDVALLFSGGVDSCSLGYAAQRLGKRVHAYTFQIGDWSSADARAAARIAHAEGWSFELVRVPLDNVRADFLQLAQRWRCVKKTQHECTWPFLYVVPVIAERFVLSGIAADGHYGLSKRAMMHYRRPKERFDEFRRAYFAARNPAGQLQQRALLEAFGHVQVAPYLDARVCDWFLGFDHDELNTPQQKHATLCAFPEEFMRNGRRSHANLQLVAGVPLVFEQLLRDATLNTKQRTRVMDLCRDYAVQQEDSDDDD